MFSGVGLNETRLKSQLKMASSQIQMASNKKAASMKRNMKEIAKFLANNPPREELARLRTEAFIQDDQLTQAYTVLKSECEFLAERIKDLLPSCYPPPELLASVSTIIYATEFSAIHTTIPASIEIRNQFSAHYGKEFVQDCICNQYNAVDKNIMSNLSRSMHSPNVATVRNYMLKICDQYEIVWTPTSNALLLRSSPSVTTAPVPTNIVDNQSSHMMQTGEGVGHFCSVESMGNINGSTNKTRISPMDGETCTFTAPPVMAQAVLAHPKTGTENLSSALISANMDFNNHKMRPTVQQEYSIYEMPPPTAPIESNSAEQMRHIGYMRSNNDFEESDLKVIKGKSYLPIKPDEPERQHLNESVCNVCSSTERTDTIGKNQNNRQKQTQIKGQPVTRNNPKMHKKHETITAEDSICQKAENGNNVPFKENPTLTSPLLKSKDIMEKPTPLHTTPLHTQLPVIEPKIPILQKSILAMDKTAQDLVDDRHDDIPDQYVWVNFTDRHGNPLDSNKIALRDIENIPVVPLNGTEKNTYEAIPVVDEEMPSPLTTTVEPIRLTIDNDMAEKLGICHIDIRQVKDLLSTNGDPNKIVVTLETNSSSIPLSCEVQCNKNNINDRNKNLLLVKNFTEKDKDKIAKTVAASVAGGFTGGVLFVAGFFVSGVAITGLAAGVGSILITKKVKKWYKVKQRNHSRSTGNNHHAGQSLEGTHLTLDLPEA